MAYFFVSKFLFLCQVSSDPHGPQNTHHDDDPEGGSPENFKDHKKYNNLVKCQLWDSMVQSINQANVFRFLNCRIFRSIVLTISGLNAKRSFKLINFIDFRLVANTKIRIPYIKRCLSILFFTGPWRYCKWMRIGNPRLNNDWLGSFADSHYFNVDPAGLRIRIRMISINLSCWIRIRIKIANITQKKKKMTEIHVLKC
jgi:hypothetical protein